MQMAFTRHKWSGYARLGKMDFQRLVRAVKNSFRLVPCLDIIVHREVVFDAAPFAFHLFFPKRQAFADIHRNVSLVLSAII